MDRREFLRRSALIAAGGIAADQLDLLDRLGWVRRFFPGWRAPASPRAITSSEWDALLMEMYSDPIILALPTETPFLAKMRRGQPRSLLKPAPVWRFDV